MITALDWESGKETRLADCRCPRKYDPNACLVYSMFSRTMTPYRTPELEEKYNRQKKITDYELAIYGT